MSAVADQKREHDKRRLLHQLKAHQVELKARSAELRQAQAERAALRRLYTDLYTFGPIGYVTLAPEGTIMAANRMALQQLSLTRACLSKVNIQSVVGPKYADSVFAMLKNLKRARFHGSLEVQLPKRSLDAGCPGARILQLLVGRAHRQILLAIMDITDTRRPEKEVVETVRRERERFRADLHDGLGQQLTGLSLSLIALRDERTTTDISWAPKLEQLRSIVAIAIKTCRTIVHGLEPVAQGGGGLIPALQMLVKGPRRRDDPTIELAVTEHSPVQLEVTTADHLYRIAQEGIKNAISHGHATVIRVVVEVSRKTITLEILNDGNPLRRTITRGHGLDIMRYRARAIHGELAIVRASHGMRVRCTCPNVGATDAKP